MTTYCANDPCEAEAVAVTSNEMPLCWTCAEAYRLGQNNSEPLTALAPDEDATEEGG